MALSRQQRLTRRREGDPSSTHFVVATLAALLLAVISYFFFVQGKEFASSRILAQKNVAQQMQSDAAKD